MTPKQYTTWLQHAIDWIDGHPTERQWDQVRNKLLEVKITSNKRIYTGTPEEIDILTYLNRKTGRNYESVPANIRFIRARIKEGATYHQLRKVIDVKTAEWLSDTEKNKYLRPATLFNQTKYAQYVGEIPTNVKLKAVEVSKCNYPGCTDPVHGQAFKRCGFHMAEEFKDPAAKQIDQVKKTLKGRMV